MDINIVAVMAAAIAAFVLGAIWYSPLLFLKPWSSAVGVDPDKNIANPLLVYGSTFLLTLVAALAMSWLLGPGAELIAAIKLGLIVGAGFVASSLTINYQFADRPSAQLLIDGGFHIVRFTLMAVVLALLS